MVSKGERMTRGDPHRFHGATVSQARTLCAARTAAMRQVGATLARSHIQYEAAFAAACRSATSSAARRASMKVCTHCSVSSTCHKGVAGGISYCFVHCMHRFPHAALLANAHE